MMFQNNDYKKVPFFMPHPLYKQTYVRINKLLFARYVRHIFYKTP